MRYPYSSTFDPPAPLFEITLSLPVTGGVINSAISPALLDTGADISVIPQHIIDELGLLPFQTTKVKYSGGDIREEIVYAINVIVAGVGSKIIGAVSSSNRKHVLLGRDFVNYFILHLEHRNNFFELI